MAAKQYRECSRRILAAAVKTDGYYFNDSNGMYTYQALESDLNALKSNYSGVTTAVLCQTPDGRQLYHVIIGNQLGRTIGFPTMNQTIDDTMVTPPNGVYITYCTLEGVRYPSITNVGNKPTVGDFGKNIETHVFNFNEEVYGIIRFQVTIRMTARPTITSTRKGRDSGS